LIQEIAMSRRSSVIMIAAAALAAAGCGHSHPAAAAVPRGEYTTQVDGNLVRLSSNARTQGYSRVVAGPIYGRLSKDATESHEFAVVAGNDYALMGACDNDCSNLDLKVYDAAGMMQMQDVAADDTPVLTFTASSTGRYRIEAIMSACSRNPCFYGVQLMAK
jgi:hypothetical protein